MLGYADQATRISRVGSFSFQRKKPVRHARLGGDGHSAADLTAHCSVGRPLTDVLHASMAYFVYYGNNIQLTNEGHTLLKNQWQLGKAITLHAKEPQIATKQQ